MEVINIAKHNRGYRYLLTVVDVFSKNAWVQPVKNKTGQAVTAPFEKILKEGRKPINVQTDDCKEFYNKRFEALTKRKGIHHLSTSIDTKASVVERFNRTLKQRLYRYFTVKNTLNFAPVLQDLVKGYNQSYHRSIKRAPNELPGWTEEVFVVRRVQKGKVPTYKVDEWDGTPIKGTFYEQDLQNVTVEDNDLFRIDKIVKRKGDKVLVRWKGWPDKYDTWLNKKDVVRKPQVNFTYNC